MNRSWIRASLVVLVALQPGIASALEGPWFTSPLVGPNQVVYTLEITCPNPGIVCDLVDGYSEQATSAVGGFGVIEIDDALDQFQFLTNSMQDVGSGPQPAYITVNGLPITFPNIPFAGVPQITNLLVFALSNPQIPATGLDLLTPGDYPFSQTINYSGSGLVIGDLEFILGPNIVVPPMDIVVSGTFRILDNPGRDFHILDMTGTFTLQNLATIGGQPVTVDVTADMTLNLAGLTGNPVPLLGPLGWAFLAMMLVATAPLAHRALRRA